MPLAEVNNSVQFSAILIGMFGGLAIFLYGMDQMTDALKTVAGAEMKRLLSKMTANRFTGIFAGAFVTSIIHSSSVTTVLLVGFISAGLMSLEQSIGVILGADIGTTMTAQIIAFKVTQYALALVAIGFALLYTAKRKRVQQYGIIMMGMGFIFFGMELMSEATHPLRTYQPFIDLMQNLQNPLLAILITTIFTAIIQSSAATVGVVIVLASQGIITLHTGIAFVFGANIGTCITAILASIGKPTEAVQSAVVHVLFKVIGVLIWLPFIDQLADFTRLISPAVVGLEGAAQMAVETPRQIANAHTIFNVGNTFLFVWFTDQIAWTMRRLIPERSVQETPLVQPKYLDDAVLDTPDLALDFTRFELRRLGQLTTAMLRQALPATVQGDEATIQRLVEADDEVDALHGAIVTYLRRLSQTDLLTAQSNQLSDYLAVANYIENIGDMVETNIAEVGFDRVHTNVQISPMTEEALRALHQKVCWTVEQAIDAVTRNDRQLAQQVIDAKPEINRLSDAIDIHLTRRLTANEPGRLDVFRIESEMIENFRRIYYFAKRIAKIATETRWERNQVAWPELVGAKVGD
ncbi:MAG: Na/Pi symporter [Caldilineaceae bacterium]